MGGLTVVVGSGRSRSVCGPGSVTGWSGRCWPRRVGERPRCVVVAVGPDATAVLVTMLARDLCPDAKVHTAVRDAEHVAPARRAGADEVVAGVQSSRSVRNPV